VSKDEAMTALGDSDLDIDIILCDVAAVGTEPCFELANWVRQNQPHLEVKIAGSLSVAADTAADLCESGPHLTRPYEPQAVVDYIKGLRAARDRE
jgi:hypothetical protein